MAKLAVKYDSLKLAAGRAVGMLRSKKVLLQEAEALRAESEDLRFRLIAAQQAKVVALAQTDEVRREKERLRTRVASMKAELELLKKVNGQLHERVAELKEANDLLSEKVAKKRK